MDDHENCAICLVLRRRGITGQKALFAHRMVELEIDLLDVMDEADEADCEIEEELMEALMADVVQVVDAQPPQHLN